MFIMAKGYSVRVVLFLVFAALLTCGVLVNRTHTPSSLDGAQHISSTFQIVDRQSAIQAHISAVALDPLFDWKQPIWFKGRILDQYSNVVSGVNVSLTWNNLTPNGSQSRQLLSDPFGEFVFAGEFGKALSVAVSKTGYFQVSESVQSFEFADPAASSYLRVQDRAVVSFRLIRSNPEVRVLKFRLDTILDSNNVLKFDPVRLRFDTSQSVSFKLRSDDSQVWSLVVSSNEGVVEADAEFPFLAPLEGYVHEFTVVDKINFSIDKFGLSSVYYFRQGSKPFFGSMKVHVEARSRFPGGDGLDAQISIVVSVNPDGGRDLTADPFLSGVKLNVDDIVNGLGPLGLESN